MYLNGIVVINILRGLLLAGVLSTSSGALARCDAVNVPTIAEIVLYNTIDLSQYNVGDEIIKVASTKTASPIECPSDGSTLLFYTGHWEVSPGISEMTSVPGIGYKLIWEDAWLGKTMEFSSDGNDYYVGSGQIGIGGNAILTLFKIAEGTGTGTLPSGYSLGRIMGNHQDIIRVELGSSVQVINPPPSCTIDNTDYLVDFGNITVSALNNGTPSTGVPFSVTLSKCPPTFKTVIATFIGKDVDGIFFANQSGTSFASGIGIELDDAKLNGIIAPGSKKEASVSNGTAKFDLKGRVVKEPFANAKAGQIQSVVTMSFEYQ